MTQAGHLLRAYRTRRGLTQQQLADLSTVSARTIGDIERGVVLRPRRDTARLLAEALGLAGRVRAEFEAVAGRLVVGEHPGLAHHLELPGPPAPLDRIIGREAEVATLRQTLVSGDQRLVVVTGLGGVGKTRVAQEVATVVRCSDGLPVWWAPAPAAGGLGPGGPGPDADPRSGGGTLHDVLARSGVTGAELTTLVGDRPALLVLDGFASAPGMGQVVALLRECGALRIMVTSRESVDSRDEAVFPLAPLPLPGPGAEGRPADLDASPAVRLLTRHARRFRPGFELTVANRAAVAGLCRHVDGVPVALEAVASWFLAYEPATVLRYLRRDPVGILEHPPAGDGELSLREVLRRAVGSFSAAERRLLASLAAVTTAWSLREAVELTGAPIEDCARLVRRWLLRGLVRPAGAADRSSFVVLGLVRHLHAVPAP